MSNYNYTKDSEETSKSIYFLNDKNIVDSFGTTTIQNPIPSMPLVEKISTDADSNAKANEELALAISSDFDDKLAILESKAALSSNAARISAFNQASAFSHQELTGEASRIWQQVTDNQNNIGTLSIHTGESVDNIVGMLGDLEEKTTISIEKARISAFNQASSYSYNTLTIAISEVDKTTYGLRNDLDGLSIKVGETYVPKTGGSFGYLDVENGVSASGLKLLTPNFKATGSEGVAIVAEDASPLKLYSNYSGIEIKVEDGLSNVNVESKSGTKSVAQSILDTAKDVAKDLSTTINAEYVKQEDFGFEYNSTDKRINLDVGGKTLSIDTTDFVKDSFLSSVKLVLKEETEGSEPLAGPVLRFTFKTSDNKIQVTDVPLSALTKIYGAEGDGLVLNTDTNNFSIDFNKVAALSTVNDVSSKIIDANAALGDANSRISAISSNNIFNLYFTGHMSLANEPQTLSSIVLEHVIHGFQNPDKNVVKNNAVFDVSLSSDASTTVEGVTFCNNDLVIIHNDGHDSQYDIPLSTLTSANFKVFHGEVSRPDLCSIYQRIDNLNKKVDDNWDKSQEEFVNVSGDTIEGEVKFKSPTEFYGDVSVLNNCQLYADALNANGAAIGWIQTNQMYVPSPDYIYITDYALNEFDASKKLLASNNAQMLKATKPTGSTTDSTAATYTTMTQYINNISSELSVQLAQKIVDDIAYSFEISVNNVFKNLSANSPLSDAVEVICEMRDALSILMVRNGGKVVIMDA